MPNPHGFNNELKERPAMRICVVSPQQIALPSVLSPQVYVSPLVIAVKGTSEGGEDCPC